MNHFSEEDCGEDNYAKLNKSDGEDKYCMYHIVFHLYVESKKTKQ